MCLAIPVKIEALIGDEMANVSIDGIRREISVALIDDAQVGDYVILHTGYALSKLDEAEAQATIELMQQEHSPLIR